MQSRGVFAHRLVYMGDMKVGGVPGCGGSFVRALVRGIEGGEDVSGV